MPLIAKTRTLYGHRRMRENEMPLAFRPFEVVHVCLNWCCLIEENNEYYTEATLTPNKPITVQKHLWK